MVTGALGSPALLSSANSFGANRHQLYGDRWTSVFWQSRDSGNA